MSSGIAMPRCGGFLETLRATAIQGVGFAADAYDMFIINIVLTMLAHEVAISPADKALITGAVIVGAIAGQLLFGLLADRLGRRPIFVTTLFFIIAGSALSALAWPIPTGPTSRVVVSLALARAALGFGIGGEYPVAASITGEQADASNRGRRIAAVFSMQGVGALLAALAGWILLLLCPSIEFDWRVALGLGVVPAALSIYPRLTKLQEPECFKQSVPVPWRAIPGAARRRWRRLLGTAGNWFLLDVLFYANGFYSSTLLAVFGIGAHAGDSVREKLIAIAGFNVVLALCALPGYASAIWLIETRLGRYWLQLLGFGALAAVYVTIGLGYHWLVHAPAAFLALYGLTFFFANAGANTTTFVLPAELYPTRLRATFFGVSAACGKVGALLGAYTVSYLVEIGPEYVFYACGGIAAAGFLLTIATTEETRGRTLDELNPKSGDDDDEIDERTPFHIQH